MTKLKLLKALLNLTIAALDLLIAWKLFKALTPDECGCKPCQPQEKAE